jgi:hypothetical protein
VKEARSAPAIAKFLSETKGVVVISDTDFTALKKHLHGQEEPLQVLYSWSYWKEMISKEDIRASLLEGGVERLMEKVHVVGR